ncbi:hypothetical protein CC2G_002011 [Coprinopsis cinerea AmutBmut pab1-1]|nr:hypothetical protein CC2G_002011 [Coprinopsis cinerea AmutBmut pab1-1]
MATPKKPTWNASLYASHRPVYPPKLFDQILEFHRQKGGQFDHALDLGCGTGQASQYLRGRFKHVTCVDPGATMIESAKKALVGDYESRSNSKGQHDTTYTFCVSPAEDLHQAVPEDGTVDLVIAATSCHWFDMTKVWPEIRRILRKGGTAAFWSYVECLLPAFPSTERLIKEYGGFEEYVTASTNFLDTIGQYYPRPQKTRAERFLVDIPSPEEVLGPQSGEGCLVDFERRYFTGTRIIIIIQSRGCRPKSSG